MREKPKSCRAVSSNTRPREIGSEGNRNNLTTRNRNRDQEEVEYGKVGLSNLNRKTSQSVTLAVEVQTEGTGTLSLKTKITIVTKGREWERPIFGEAEDRWARAFAGQISDFRWGSIVGSPQ